MLEKIKRTFWKNLKTLFPIILGPFCPFFDKTAFSQITWLYQFLDFKIIYHHAQNLKIKKISVIEENFQPTDVQRGKSRFIGPSV